MVLIVLFFLKILPPAFLYLSLRGKQKLTDSYYENAKEVQYLDSDSLTSGSSLVEHRRRRYSFNEGN
jgi:hypothetical protein